LGEIFQLAEYSVLQTILLEEYSEIWMTFWAQHFAGGEFPDSNKVADGKHYYSPEIDSSLRGRYKCKQDITVTKSTY